MSMEMTQPEPAADGTQEAAQEAEGGFHTTFGASRWMGKEHEMATYADRWMTQYVTLLVKAWLTFWRKKSVLVLMLLVPFFSLCVFLMDGTGGSGGDNEQDSATFEPVSLDAVAGCHAWATEEKGVDCIKVVYGPNASFSNGAINDGSGNGTSTRAVGEQADAIMARFASEHGFLLGEDIVSEATKEDATLFVARHLGQVEYTVLFENASQGNEISWVVSTNGSERPKSMDSKTAGIDIELLSFQKEMEEAISWFLLGSPENAPSYRVNYSRYERLSSSDAVALQTTNSSSICGQRLRDYTDLALAAPWVVIMPMTILSFFVFQVFVDERVNKLVTALRRLGLMDSAYIMAWVTATTIILILGSTIGTAFAKLLASHFLQKTSFGAIFLLVFMYNLAMTGQAYFLSTVVRSQSMATFATFFVFVTLCVTLVSVQDVLIDFEFKRHPDTGQLVCAAGTNSLTDVWGNLFGGDFVEFIVFFLPWFHAERILADMLSIVRYKGQSFTMSNYSKDWIVISGTSELDIPNTMFSVEMLAAAFIVYIFMGWFAGLALSDESAEGRTLASIFIPGPIRKMLFHSGEGLMLDGDVRGKEKQASLQEGSVRIYKISKTFTGTTALKEVSMRMNSGEVFALLGHNGAGKSTLINILSGIMLPTHGKAFVKGLDVEEDVAELESRLGVCPQHDTLFDSLTAKEHMIVYAMFKGLSYGPALNEAVDETLEKVGLKTRADTLAANFSGGMKRRLSVAMATVGSCHILIFDEPTTGLDPLSKRQVWDMINWVKRDRVVVLTTHNMEEADALGDTICFLHGGRMRAIGDSLFLKQTYGKGYQISLAVNKHAVDEVQHAVANLLPGARCDQMDYAGLQEGALSAADDHQRLAGADVTSARQAAPAAATDAGAATKVPPQQQGDAASGTAGATSGVENDRAQIVITLNRHVVRFLPPFFDWVTDHSINDAHLGEDTDGQAQDQAVLDASKLEAGKDIDRFIREWGLSNTTLEQVFMKLCVQNTEVNAGAEDVKTKTLCVLCQQRVASDVCLLTKTQVEFELCSVLCQQCAAVPPDFARKTHKGVELAVTTSSGEKDNVEYAGESKEVEMDAGAHMNVTSPLHPSTSGHSDADAVNRSHSLPDQPGNANGAASTAPATPEVSISTGSSVEPVVDVTQPNVLARAHAPIPITPIRESPNAPPYVRARVEDTSTVALVDTQIHALMLKNLKLQWKQKRSNCCVGCFVVFMMILLYVFGLLFGSLRQCKGGYYDFDINTCSTFGLAHYLFEEYNDYGGEYHTLYSHPDPVDYMSGPNTVYRPNVAWSDRNLSGSRQNGWLDSTGGDFNLYDIPSVVWASPEGGVVDDDGPHDAQFFTPSEIMYEHQLLAQEGILDSPVLVDSPLCESIWREPGGFTDNATDALKNFTRLFSEATFECNAGGCNGSRGQFEGTLWHAGISRKQEDFPFGFITFLNDESSSLNDCPSGYETISMSYDYSVQKQTAAMNWVNTLSQVVLTIPQSPANDDVWRHTITTKSIELGELFFDAAAVSRFISYFMVLITMLILSALWPLAVWRVAYERSRRLRTLMKTIGVHTISYIMGMYLFDFLISTSLALVVVGSAVAFKLVNFADVPTGGLMGVCIAGSHMSSAFTFLFVRAFGTASRLATLVASILTIAMAISSGILHLLVFDSDGSWPWALSLIPFFGQSRAFFVLLAFGRTTGEYNDAMYCMIFGGFLLLGLEFALDSGNMEIGAVFQMINGWYLTSTGQNVLLHYQPVHGTDEDVMAEKRKMDRLKPEDMGHYAVAVRDYYLAYPATSGDRPFLAVRGLTFGLEFGECFGLLGPNGAGKSTTISTLSGMTDATGGSVFVGGYDVSFSKIPIYATTGICPQDDVVWDDLSTQEHLVAQARCRGVPSVRVDAEVQRVAITVGLDGDAFDTKAKELSGGMRRRLSIALSIMGDPAVLFLDEPTTGLDPDTRRSIWKIIHSLKQPNRLILLTTHSMEEAEALCSRIGIMAKGTLQALGTPIHLKQRYGKGYTMVVNTLGTDHLATVDKYVRETVCSGSPGVLVVSAVNRTRKYVIPREAATVSRIFDTMEAQKDALGIREWGVSMTSLEEVFISLAKSTAEGYIPEPGDSPPVAAVPASPRTQNAPKLAVHPPMQAPQPIAEEVGVSEVKAGDADGDGDGDA